MVRQETANNDTSLVVFKERRRIVKTVMRAITFLMVSVTERELRSEDPLLRL